MDKHEYTTLRAHLMYTPGCREAMEVVDRWFQDHPTVEDLPEEDLPARVQEAREMLEALIESGYPATS